MLEHTSDINIKVTLDEDNIPSKISWSATDQGPNADAEAKAFLLSIFDKDHKDTLKIDLWTKEMQVVEMDRLYFNTLKGLSDSYMRATGNKKLAGAMQQFAQYFGEQVEILTKEKK